MLSSDLLLILPAPAMGSFITVAASRFPEMQGVAFGRSRCPSCRNPIAARDLVPLVSWALLRARCRCCRARISALYPAVELAALAVPLSAAPLMSGWLLLASCLLGWGLLALAAIDARTLCLPDFLTVPLAGMGLAITALAWPDALPAHLAGALLGFAALASLRALHARWRGQEGLGLGDAKLAAAAGAWLSWEALPGVVLVAAGLALVLVGLRSLLSGAPPAALQRLAFGPYLCLAIWLSWLYGPLEIAP